MSDCDVAKMDEFMSQPYDGGDTAYTIESLTALDDSALNALAAELRGAKLTGLLGKEEIDVWEFPEKPAHDNYKLQIRVADWSPTTDRNQSGELLRWAAQKDYVFGVWFGAGSDINCLFGDKGVRVPNNDARAETIAFCAAMLAMEGRLR